MKYKVSVIKKIAFLVMTMALAVALVACSGAVGKPGEAGAAGAAADPVPQPPYVALPIDDLPVVQGSSDTVSLNEAFSDPEGKALTFTAESTDKTIATATVTGATLTVTGVGVGSTKVVVTATDADGLSVGQSLKVTVTEAPPEPITIDDVKTAYPTLEITPTAESKSEDIELPAGYTLNSLNEAIVAVARKTATTSVAGSVKWAAATANAANVWVVTAVSAGITNVDVLDSSEILAHSIRVTVTAAPPPDPIPPTVTETLPDVWLGIDARTSETFDLDDHFQHSSAIAYSATFFGHRTIATATIEGSMLTVTSADTGRTRVVVTATAEGQSVQDGFQVEVHYTKPYTHGRDSQP